MLQMSKFEKPKYEGRSLENQLISTIIGCHDLCCGCDSPIRHCHKILQCRLTEDDPTGKETGGITETKDYDIDAEDLENLFAENPGDG